MTLHMIGNAHLDPVWLWRWPEGMAEALATCLAAVERLDEHDTFVFTRGEAQVYAWVEELDAALHARIKEHVRSGRWHIVGAWWVQPDCNLPSGEAFLRQALYGRAYLEASFGALSTTTGFNVDSFGHAATLPMLLRHAGLERYVFMRPMPHEMELPGPLFSWSAPDGSSVLTYRIPEAYQTRHTTLQEALEVHRRLLTDVDHDLMCFFGVGNHGGGATREDLALLDSDIGRGGDLVYSDPDAFFDAIESGAGSAVAKARSPTTGRQRWEPPDVVTELQYHAIGCYAAVSELKAVNRQAEAHLAMAETAATLAHTRAGADYPRPALGSLWRTLLFNQFHDILGGSSLPSATEDAIQALGGVIQGADQLLHRALRQIAATIRSAEPAHPDATGAAFLVFNLSGQPQNLPIEYEPWLDLDMQPRYDLRDAAGETVPWQEIEPESTTLFMRRIVFRAELPAYGYALYRFTRAVGAPMIDGAELNVVNVSHSGGSSGTNTSRRPVVMTDENRPDPWRINTSRWHLELDPATGAIARLFDHVAGREVLRDGAHQAIVVPDDSDTWSHGLDRFGLEGEVFRAVGAHIVERGPLRTCVLVESRHEDSWLRSTYVLYEDPNLPLEIRVVLDWHQPHALLRLRYPVALHRPTFRYEVPYGSLERPADGREVPGHAWVLVRDDTYGLAIANDAKYSYAASEAALYITALRSPRMAHHAPASVERLDAQQHADIGLHSFRLRIQAGAEMDAMAAHRLAEGLLRSPLVVPHVTRRGTLPPAGTLLRVERNGPPGTPPSVAPVWVKLAEHRDELTVRLLELNGHEDSLRLDGQDTLRLGPYQIATVRRGPEGWLASDGLER